MKAITTMMIAILYTAVSYGQSLINTDLSNENATTASVVKMNQSKQSANMVYHDYTTRDCAKYHKMKVAGIILASVGGGMFLTGATMIAVDNQRVYYNDDPNRNHPFGPYRPLRAGGSAMMGIGFLSMGAGIPLAIVGGVKGRRYCGAAAIPASRSYIDLHSGANGTGLALNF